MPTCSNCAHAIRISSCLCDKTSDPVTGNAMSCYAARDSDKLCGPDGKWFARRQNASGIIEGLEPKGHKYAETDPGIQERIKSARPPELDDYKPESKA